MKKIIITVGLLLAAMNSIADGWNNWTKYQVKSIIAEGSDDAHAFTIRITPTLTDTSCTDPSYLRLDASTDKGKYIMSILLSSEARGSKFHIQTSGCVSGQRPIIVGIWTLP